jgi:hypothetical protein
LESICFPNSSNTNFLVVVPKGVRISGYQGKAPSTYSPQRLARGGLIFFYFFLIIFPQRCILNDRSK